MLTVTKERVGSLKFTLYHVDGEPKDRALADHLTALIELVMGLAIDEAVLDYEPEEA